MYNCEETMLELETSLWLIDFITEASMETEHFTGCILC